MASEEGIDIIILVNGYPQGPNGLIVADGSVGFQLNVDATVIAAPYGFVSGSIEVVFQFNAAGQIQPNSGAAAQIYSNAELNPQNSAGLGTYYLVTFYDANGARINKVPMWWQFPEAAGSTVDISQVTPISTVGGNVIFYPTNFGGGGTVTSVAFVGDGTILSATPSDPVTTSGDIAATLLTQGANTVLAGPATGSAAAPTFRALVAADIPSVATLWNNLGAATGNATLANTTFGTTFNQTSAVTWEWANITAATSGANQNSPILELAGKYWTGSVSATDSWTLQNVLGVGANPSSTFNLVHAGSSSAAIVFNFTDTSVNIGDNLAVGNAITAPQCAIAFFTDGAGGTFSISSVASSVGNLATYQATISAGAQPPAGMRVTIAGFVTHSSNNGYFIVQSATTSSVTVYNSSAVSETHSATGTVDVGYINQAGYSANLGVATNFSIVGTVYTTESGFENVPAAPIISLNAKGDAVDAGYLRILNDGATGNHGLEIGAIIDGTGAAPITLQMGNFAGINVVRVGQPIAASGGGNQSSNYLGVEGHYWTGSASTADIWSFQNMLGTGTTPTSTLTLSHSGSSGVALVSLGTLGLACGTLYETVTHTPSSATDTGITGQIAWDASYIYVCTATNTWKRVQILTW